MDPDQDMVQLTIRMHRLQEELTNENSRHEREINRLHEERKETQAQLNRLAAGLNEAKVRRGMSVLSILGNYTNSGGEKLHAIHAAINDLAIGNGKELSRHCFGVKDYDRWTGQRCDCNYNCGPAHGRITFEVGLAEQYRGSDGEALTHDDIEAAIYCLYNLVEIEKARQEASELVIA